MNTAVIVLINNKFSYLLLVKTTFTCLFKFLLRFLRFFGKICFFFLSFPNMLINIMKFPKIILTCLDNQARNGCYFLNLNFITFLFCVFLRNITGTKLSVFKL